MNGYMDLFLTLLAVGLNASAQLFLREGMLRVGRSSLSSQGITFALSGAMASPKVWGGLGCYGISLALWLRVLSRVEVGRAYPLQGLGYAIVAIAGWWMFGETVSFSKMIGIVVIGIGAYLVFHQ